jgi:hypothetical protein
MADSREQHVCIKFYGNFWNIESNFWTADSGKNTVFGWLSKKVVCPLLKMMNAQEFCQ